MRVDDMAYMCVSVVDFFFTDTATTEIYTYWHTLSLHDALPICSNNYGPYQFPEKLIPLFLLNALSGKPLPIYGDGMQIRDWLHVEDHCLGVALVLDGDAIGK